MSMTKAELNSSRTAGLTFKINAWVKVCQVECFTFASPPNRFPDQIRDSPSKEDQITLHLKEFLGSWAVGGWRTASSFLAHSKVVSFAALRRARHL